ncbi:putative pumilio homolog 7, chloroplastic [Cornus florida]|uniref:putative pumilio homolog 7, chloroplastic n=1 Tax=Cornus florida TaxID=4283 RepID=UPI00289E97B5|nr:putative pumilio homolog 7, chloroplastic [Cornus florida]
MMFPDKRAGKERKSSGNALVERALEMLNDIPLNHNLRHQNKHHLLMSVSPISPSCSSSTGFCSSDNGFSPSLTPFDDSMYGTPSPLYSDSQFVNNSNGYEHDLSENLYRFNIGDENKKCLMGGNFQTDPSGFGFSDRHLSGISPRNVENYSAFEGFRNNGCDYGEFQSLNQGNLTSLDGDMRKTLVGWPEGYNVGDLMRSGLTQSQSNVLQSDPSCYSNMTDFLMDQTRRQGRGCCNNGVQVQSPYSSVLNNLSDDFYCSQQSGLDSNGDMGILNPMNSSRLMNPKFGSSVENPIYNHSMLKQKTTAISNGCVPPSLLSTDLEGFSCEDSLIFQGRSSKHVSDKGRDRCNGRKKDSYYEIAMLNRREKGLDMYMQSEYGGIIENGLSDSTSNLQLNHRSLAELQGYMYLLAKDQQGCRFLQSIFEEGTHQDKQIVFNEIINHVVELMINPFGNYLMQKLLDVCNEEQRTQIVFMVTEEPRELVRISLNTHGTRVVQKLIETLKTRQQITLLVSALKPGFLDLIKDPNGNHVLQHCLECLSNDDNKFIFDVAAKFCVGIATHRHGCCVLNRCIAHSTGKYREKLVAEIASNGFLLAQDAFGNYVVQYIIELKIPSAASMLTSQFEGHYVYLSMQKFSSHVVEKCVKYFEESRSRIINEFLSVPLFEQLLQDPYANYVIKTALVYTKGRLHASLVEAVRPHMTLRTSPYCKKIFSGNLLKK